jgi:hypothetical protein
MLSERNAEKWKAGEKVASMQRSKESFEEDKQTQVCVALGRRAKARKEELDGLTRGLRRWPRSRTQVAGLGTVLVSPGRVCH